MNKIWFFVNTVNTENRTFGFYTESTYELIMEYPRLYGNGLRYMKWLPYVEFVAIRPTVIKYTTFYEDHPNNWRKYVGKQA